MRLAVVAVICFLVHTPVGADGWVMLSPGPGYLIEWRANSTHRIIVRPQVGVQGLSPLDRWFQVAPGGGTVALWSEATGLTVFTASGLELVHRQGEVTAFRFAPQGDRLAFASAKGIEVLALDQHEPRLLRPLAGVDTLRWADAGLIARTRSKLYLVDSVGNQRTLAELRPIVMVAARAQLVYFTSGSLVTIDLANGRAAVVVKLADREPVINAEISPDGANLLFATAKRVYLREGTGPIRTLAEAADVRSLFFSPDGAAYLWATAAGSGVVVGGGKITALPPGTRSARFSQRRGGELVVTTDGGVITWDPTTGERSIVGGISSDDGVNLAGDLAGSTAVAFYYKKSGYEKETQRPIIPRL